MHIVKSARQTLLIIIILMLAPGGQRTVHAVVANDLIADVVAKVLPAVVRIITVRPLKGKHNEPATNKLGTAWSHYTATSIGSGFFIDPSGFVATNKHVIERGSVLLVVTSDGIFHEAKIVGMTANADMALLKIEPQGNVPFIVLGDSDKMRVGDPVIAIGSPFGLYNSVTTGIISAVNRDMMESPFDDYFQTDAATNQGNSGGPLLNLAGEAIGMNSVIITPGPGWVGLTFALPSNGLKFVFGRLMKTGEIKAGMLPIHTQEVGWLLMRAFNTPGLEGALVSAVDDEDGTMLHGQISPGDMVLSFNGEKVLDPRDLARKAAQTPIGSDATLEIYRAGERKIVHVTIQAWPEEKPDQPVGGPQLKIGMELALGQRKTGEPAVVVASVDPAGTAADSGILKGDIVLQVQQTLVSDSAQASRLLEEQLSQKSPFAAILIERDKRRIWVPIVLADQAFHH